MTSPDSSASCQQRQLAESHLTRRFFRQILGRIARLAGHPRDHEPHGVKAMKSERDPRGVALNGRSE
jgi:hypothetical protein